MFNRHTHDRFTSRVIAGLVVAATMAMASLGYAAAHIQIVA